MCPIVLLPKIFATTGYRSTIAGNPHKIFQHVEIAYKDLTVLCQRLNIWTTAGGLLRAIGVGLWCA